MSRAPHARPKGPAVRRNEWREALAQVPLPAEPTLSVSVIIPAYNAAETLDLTLASLAAQDYPEDLLEVIVVDDGSVPSYALPAIRPPRSRVVLVTDGWGQSNACDLGAREARGDLLLRLDADLIVPRDHVRAHALVHHVIADAATKGDLLFVPSWRTTADEIYDAVCDDDLTNVLGDPTALERQWIEDVYAITDDLNSAGPHRFSILTGASSMFSRKMYFDAGGFDVDLRTGEDSELAHRLAQMGAVFVPVRDSPAYHLGPSATQLRNKAIRYYDSPHFARRAPQILGRRTSLGRQWEVPKVRAVVKVGEDDVKCVRAAVDRLLASTEEDLAVTLVGEWGRRVHNSRRNVLDDPDMEFYLIQEWYAGEGRVSFAEEGPQTGFPSPYLLEVPPTVGVDNLFVEQLLKTMVKKNLGLITVPFVGRAQGETVSLFRTAAHTRALRHQGVGESLTKTIDRVWGAWVHDPRVFELEDLTTVPDLHAPVGRRRLTSQDDSRIATLESRVRRLKAANERLKKKNARLRLLVEGSPSIRSQLGALRRVLGNLLRSVFRRLTRRSDLP